MASVPKLQAVPPRLILSGNFDQLHLHIDTSIDPPLCGSGNLAKSNTSRLLLLNRHTYSRLNMENWKT